MTHRSKVPWSKGDKLLMLALGVGLPLVLGLWLWFRALDQNPVVTIPTPPMPSPNARDYYIAAYNALVEGKKVEAAFAPWNPTDGTPPISLSAKEKLVAENLGALQTLHTGFRYPYQELPSRSFNAEFPHYQKMRALARFLGLQARVDAAKGDSGGAMTASLDAVQMGETMPRGGSLIGMLVGVACQAIGRKPTWGVVDRLSAAQARGAARRLEQIRAAHVPLADVLQEEKWETQASLLELMHRPDWTGNLLTLSMPSDQQGDPSPASWLMATRVRLVGKRTLMANYTRYMDQSIANARQPYAAQPAPPPIPGDTLSQILLPVFSGVRINETRSEAQNALLLATLALRAYRLDHGAYPPTLAALAPTYLRAVPDDPFALSGPLRYRRTGAKYLLYSVGPDGKDDGGVPIFDRTKSAPGSVGAGDPRYWVMPESKGDIVAGVNR